MLDRMAFRMHPVVDHSCKQVRLEVFLALGFVQVLDNIRV